MSAELQFGTSGFYILTLTKAYLCHAESDFSVSQSEVRIFPQEGASPAGRSFYDSFVQKKSMKLHLTGNIIY